MQKVLVVEDDQHIAALIRKILEAEEFTVVHATDPQGAWSTLMAEDPDGAVVDLTLQWQTTGGWDFVERVRANDHFKGLPVLIVTGASGPEIKEHAASLGCEYLGKPFSPAALVDRLRLIIKRAGRLPALREVPVILLVGAYRVEGVIHVPADLGRFSDAWEAVVRDPRSFVPVARARVTTLDGSEVLAASEVLEVKKSDVSAATPST